MENKIKDILSQNKIIAMIGVSQDLKKTSTIVMKYMQKYGYKVIPVNPSSKGKIILGEKVYESLDKIGNTVDIVNVFRPSEEALSLAKDTIKLEQKFFGYNLGLKI